MSIAFSCLLLVFVSFGVGKAQVPSLPITKVVIEQGPGGVNTAAKFYFEGPQLSFNAGNADCNILPYSLQQYPRDRYLSLSAPFYCNLVGATNGFPAPTVLGDARYFEFEGLNISGPSIRVRAPFGRDFERGYIPVEIAGKFKAYSGNPIYNGAKLIFTSDFRLRGRAYISLKLEPFVYGLYTTRHFKYEFDETVVSNEDEKQGESADKQN